MPRVGCFGSALAEAWCADVSSRPRSQSGIVTGIRLSVTVVIIAVSVALALARNLLLRTCSFFQRINSVNNAHAGALWIHVSVTRVRNLPSDADLIRNCIDVLSRLKGLG